MHDDDLQVIETLKEVARQKVVAEAEQAGVAPALSNRKSWLRFKRENAKAWSQAMIEKLGLNCTKSSSTPAFRSQASTEAQTASKTRTHHDGHDLQKHFSQEHFGQEFFDLIRSSSTSDFPHPSNPSVSQFGNPLA